MKWGEVPRVGGITQPSPGAAPASRFLKKADHEVWTLAGSAFQASNISSTYAAFVPFKKFSLNWRNGTDAFE